MVDEISEPADDSSVMSVLADDTFSVSVLAGSVLKGREHDVGVNDIVTSDIDAGLAAIPFLRSVAFFSGKHTGQSVLVQFFQCVIICLDDEQCGTETTTIYNG